jgi:hypothetical protein
MRQGTRPANIIAVDWGKEIRKRAAYLASLDRHEVSRLEFDGSLSHLLQIAENLKPPVLIGIDAAIGFPYEAWRKLVDRLPIQNDNFIDFLFGPDLPQDFFEPVSTPEDWSPVRPFIRPPRQWSRKAFEVASKDGFYRVIDSRLHGSPIFITSGMPGTVASGTLALWKELIGLSRSKDFRVWPFHGNLQDLMDTGLPVIAEIYPKACYGLALSGSIPASLVSLAKTKEPARKSAVSQLVNCGWVKQSNVVLRDQDVAISNEDDFDACISAAALLRLFLQSEHRFDSPDVQYLFIEGDVLGSVYIADGKLESFEGTKSSRKTREPKRLKKATKYFACPIKGCQKIFRNTRSGWDAHVGSLKRHPDWHTEMTEKAERIRLFREEFSDWFSTK